MKALILSAGQGSRLLPLTTERPKCLLPLDSRCVLEWQVRELRRFGTDEIVVMMGFGADEVERLLAKLATPGLRIRTIYNPFFQVADNLSTCWIARHEMHGDFLLLNGDTVFEAAVATRLLSQAGAPVNVAIDRAAAYDADDMKVSIEGRQLSAIGKWLPAAETHAEAIGLMSFRGRGPALFADEIERMMRTPEGLDYWYTSAIDSLAKRGLVDAVSVEGLDWGEIDFPRDLLRARAMVQRWTAAEERAERAAT